MPRSAGSDRVERPYMRTPKPLVVALAAAISVPAMAASNTLVGWAMMPADTFSDGPTSGQMTNANPYGTFAPPYEGRQPVQGFSAVLPGADENSFIFMTDNGFGGQTNSADTLLRLYSVRPDFRTAVQQGGALVGLDPPGQDWPGWSVPGSQPRRRALK